MVLAAEPPSILVHAWLGAEFVTHVHPVESEPAIGSAHAPNPWNRGHRHGRGRLGGRSGLRPGQSISEFRARGPVGGNDEFVELRNTSAAPVAIGGWAAAGLRDRHAGQPEQPRDGDRPA